MALSDQSRSKALAKAAELLGPDAPPRSYVVGRGHARWSPGATAATAGFAVVFVVALLAGYVLLPGWLLAVYLFHEVRPPRALALTDRGVALLQRSFWNTRPSAVIGMFPLPVTAPGAALSPVGLGAERVTLSTAESNRFRSALATMMPPPPPPPPPLTTPPHRGAVG